MAVGVGYHQVIAPTDPADDPCPNVCRDGHHPPKDCARTGEDGVLRAACYLCLACFMHVRAERYDAHVTRCRKAAGMSR